MIVRWSGWVSAAKIQAVRECRSKCRCEMCSYKINDLMKEKTDTSVLFIHPDPLGPLASFLPLTPIWLSLLLGPSPLLPQNCSLYYSLSRNPFPFRNCWAAAIIDEYQSRPNRAYTKSSTRIVYVKANTLAVMIYNTYSKGI